MESFKKGRGRLAVAVFLVFLPLAMAISGLVAADRWVRRDMLREADRKAKQARSEVQEYLRVRARLAANPFFSQKRAGGDAGPFLNDKIAWYGVSKKKVELRLEQKVFESLRKLDGHWAEKGRGEDRPDADTSWMARLHEYAYWDVKPAEGKYRLFDVPSANYSAMPQWAKIRLMQGLDGGDLRSAAADVRQLAWLLHSTQEVGGLGRAREILEQERMAFETAVAQGMPVGGWVPTMTAKETEELRLVTEAAGAMASPAVPADVWKNSLASTPDAIGRCAALAVAVQYAEVLRRLGLRGDHEYVERVADEIASSRDCRGTRTKMLRDSQGDAAYLVEIFIGRTDLMQLCRRVSPWYCRSLARQYLVAYETGSTPHFDGSPSDGTCE
ncbi:MAG TPA: hypothetical protein VGK67_03475 [Myxococcales bacterium]|jgi:hypothetical protein